MSPDAPQDVRLEAAEIAATILRFQEPLAHLSSSSTPEGLPRVGVDAYKFMPSSRLILRHEVPSYLAALPCPAFLAPTTVRGCISVMLLDELAGERRRVMEHDLANQSTGLTESAPGPDSDRVLLEFDDEARVFSLAALRLWAGLYPIFVGWNVVRCSNPNRAEWQLNLFGGDGHRYSKGVGRSSGT